MADATLSSRLAGVSTVLPHTPRVFTEREMFELLEASGATPVVAHSSTSKVLAVGGYAFKLMRTDRRNELESEKRAALCTSIGTAKLVGVGEFGTDNHVRAHTHGVFVPALVLIYELADDTLARDECVVVSRTKDGVTAALDGAQRFGVALDVAIAVRALHGRATGKEWTLDTLRPEHVLLFATERGVTAKLCGLRAALVRDAAADSSHTVVFDGPRRQATTVHIDRYSPPERELQFGEHTDVFALGMIMLDLALGASQEVVERTAMLIGPSRVVEPARAERVVDALFVMHKAALCALFGRCARAWLLLAVQCIAPAHTRIRHARDVVRELLVLANAHGEYEPGQVARVLGDHCIVCFARGAPYTITCARHRTCDACRSDACAGRAVTREEEGQVVVGPCSV